MPSHADTLRARIGTGDATICVLGLGYVGLPLLCAFHEVGFKVLGFDVDPQKPSMLKSGVNYLPHLGDARTAPLVGSDRFDATTDPARLAEADALLICVPTPLAPGNEPDLSYVEATARDIGRAWRPGQLIVLESTTYPGTTRDVLLPALEAGAGRSVSVGEDCFIAFSPEREDPGRDSHSTRTIPKLVGGLDDTSTDLAAALYRTAIREVHVVRDAEVAEAAKLLENVFRAVNIALANEMKLVLDKMGIDVWEVIDAAATKPFGFMPFYPGPGLGGHCIPIDPFYLAWKAKQAGTEARFIELAGQINTGMPEHVVSRLAETLVQRGTPVENARVIVLGLAYKPNVSDVRESPSFVLIEKLKALGIDVAYHDPHVPHTWPGRKHDLGMSSVELTDDAIGNADALLVSTHHSAVDYARIARLAKLVIDTRGVMRPHANAMGDRLVQA